MGESTPTSVQPSVSFPSPALTSPPSISVLEKVVPHVSSSSRDETKLSLSNRPPRLPRTTQPPMVFVVPMTIPSVAKGKAPMLSKYAAHPPFELSIMADIPWPSHYEKREHSSRVPLS